MPTTKRRSQTGLIGQLIARPQRFNFFQAVRVVDLWLRRGAAAHGKSLDGVLRFKNSVSLAFPASQIEALDVDTAAPSDDASQHVPDARRLRRIRITPAFMGFLGANGVLPHDYTATIAEQIHFNKNDGGRAFFDTFSHRSMTLFYRAWAKGRIECRGDGTGTDFLDVQCALAGRPRHLAATPKVSDAPCPAQTEALPDEVIARYAALIRHRPMPGDMIAGVLADYFGVPFRFEPFVGDWITPDRQNRTVLGGQNAVLGNGALLGPRYWRRDAIARLWVGPLARVDFDRFLADGSAGGALKALVGLFAVPAMVFEVRLILRAADIASARLDGCARLGQGAFLQTTPPATDHDQTRYHIAF